MKMTALLNGLKVAHESYYDNGKDSLVLKDGTILSYYGDENEGPNDCFNYADWSALEDTGFFEDDITADNLKLESCEYGIRINGYFVPCYSSQNGYYTDVVTINAVKDGNLIATINTTCEHC